MSDLDDKRGTKRPDDGHHGAEVEESVDGLPATSSKAPNQEALPNAPSQSVAGGTTGLPIAAEAAEELHDANVGPGGNAQTGVGQKGVGSAAAISETSSQKGPPLVRRSSPPAARDPHRSRQELLALDFIANVLGVWLGLLSIPSALIFASDRSYTAKLAWFTAAAAICLLLTVALYIVIRRIQLSRATGRRGRDAFRATEWGALAVVLSLSVLIPLVVPRIISELEGDVVIIPKSSSCLEIGVGEPGYEAAFRSAYEAHDGARRLGCATNRVTRIERGVHQNFIGPDGLGAIFATDPQRALVLVPQYHEAFRAIGGGDGVQSTVRAGYPLDEGKEIAGGSMLTVGAGGFETSGVVRKEKEQWIWVPPRIWEVYAGKGGPLGSLGFPVSVAQPAPNSADLKQTFEGGALCAGRGTAYEC